MIYDCSLEVRQCCSSQPHGTSTCQSDDGRLQENITFLPGQRSQFSNPGCPANHLHWSHSWIQRCGWGDTVLGWVVCFHQWEALKQQVNSKGSIWCPESHEISHKWGNACNSGLKINWMQFRGERLHEFWDSRVNVQGFIDHFQQSWWNKSTLEIGTVNS